MDCLDALTARGIRWPCTNKALELTPRSSTVLDLRRFFGAVIGGDSLPQKKPDPAP